ncbi:hypothetical protein RDWZM_001153 [Blomia tropicalis]|uniref:Uncharacterized protein n=1 Tax=Blomia tropicalis TaxID=40697 RepID=A0A9Q0RNN9_BLOTA|nr:hypothetical protein RDWZM_001153 [Blomia tropicalis]
MNRYTIVTRIMLIMATILMVDMFAIQVMAQANNGTTTANLNVDGNNSSVTSISTSVTNPITPSTINADVTVSTPANPGAGNETTPPTPVQTTTPEPVNVEWKYYM